MATTRHPSTRAIHAFSLLSLLSATTAMAQHTVALPPVRREAPHHPRSIIPIAKLSGCYSSGAGLTDQGASQFEASGHCQPICVAQNQAVYAMSGGTDCWCGDTLPPADTKVDDSQCSISCPGWPSESCGGINFWTVWLSGTSNSVANAEDSSNPSSSSQSSTASPTAITTTALVVAAAPPATSTTASTTSVVTPSVVTSEGPGKTIIVTQSASPAAQTSSSPTAAPEKSHSNTAGVAAGVVVGLVLAAAGIAALVFWIKHKRRKQANEAYTRSNQVSEFIHGGREPKLPPTAYSNASDSRLDPEYGARRNSVGSIADNGDYSRKILRVANPDRG